MFDRFLVPLDGSKLAEKAALAAAELARLCSAELIFLRVCPGEVAVKDAVEYLDYIGRAARSEGLRVRSEAYIGDPNTKIVEVANTENIDLIIMSSHGRTGISRSVFGSVAETVMRNSSCPVMVVKIDKPENSPISLAVSPA